jgi:hypothetical protein
MSLRAAINAFCKSCLYDPIGGSGTWRQQVEACTAPHCPLYPVRPKSTASGAEDEESGNLAPEPAVSTDSEVRHG